MDFPIDQVGSYLEVIQDNWEIVSVAILAGLASFDKLALVAIKTLSNIRDAWRDSFGKDRV